LMLSDVLPLLWSILRMSGSLNCLSISLRVARPQDILIILSLGS